MLEGFAIVRHRPHLPMFSSPVELHVYVYVGDKCQDHITAEQIEKCYSEDSLADQL